MNPSQLIGIPANPILNLQKRNNYFSLIKDLPIVFLNNGNYTFKQGANAYTYPTNTPAGNVALADMSVGTGAYKTVFSVTGSGIINFIHSAGGNNSFLTMVQKLRITLDNVSQEISWINTMGSGRLLFIGQTLCGVVSATAGTTYSNAAGIGNVGDDGLNYADLTINGVTKRLPYMTAGTPIVPSAHQANAFGFPVLRFEKRALIEAYQESAPVSGVYAGVFYHLDVL